MIIFIVCSLYKYVDKLLLSPEYDVFVSQISYEKHFDRKGYDTFAQFSEGQNFPRVNGKSVQWLAAAAASVF